MWHCQLNSLPLGYSCSIQELHDRVSTETGRKNIREEYHKIDQDQRKPWNTALKKENSNKNRYSSILPYDETRVILGLLPGDNSSDYINANYIDGYNRKKEYIATQAPLENTVNDFWRMVWQESANKIITLANYAEETNEKTANLHKYWPDSKASYGDITVAITSTVASAGIVIRTFNVSKIHIGVNREVKQLHFTAWPDMKVPERKEEFADLLLSAREYKPHDTAPIIIHCSAGVGRTGTTILTDSVLQMALKTGEVRFRERLNNMREFRFSLVETEDQYLFAHEAVDYILQRNDTSSCTLCNNQRSEKDLYGDHNIRSL